MANEAILQPIPHIGRTNNEEQFVQFKSQTGAPVSETVVQTPPPVHNIYPDGDTSDISRVDASGTFTPQFTFGGKSAGMIYASSEAQYVRTNGVTTIWLRLVLADTGTSQGTASIIGLPFPAKFGALGVATANRAGGLGPMFAQVVAGASEITLWEQNANNLTALTEINFNDGADVAVCISYIS